MILRAMLVLSAWLGSSVLGAAADNPTISNRPPKPNEVGYRPGDGQTVRLNPPSFIWLHEKDAATYEIQWATQPDFANAETARGFVWNTYTHHTPLASGEYVWRYRFTTQDGRQSGWSAVRKVVVPADALLTTCVYRDLHGSKFHYQWAHSTAAHNGVLVDGEGQIKHTPATFQFMLHALRAFEMDEAKQRLTVQQPQAGVDVQYLSPRPLSFRQWDGYTPPPTKESPNQWHVEAGTREPVQRLGMLTVLVPYRAGQQPAWSAERLETDDRLGVRFVCGGREQTVWFPQPGRGGRAAVEDGR